MTRDAPQSSQALDRYAAEALSPLFSAAPVIIDCNLPAAIREARRAAHNTQAIVIGIDRAGELPPVESAPFDLLLTSASEPPRPWVGSGRTGLASLIDRVVRPIGACPIAASVLCRTLRVGVTLSFGAALELESLAYSTLLGGAEFRLWRTRVDRVTQQGSHGAPVIYERSETGVALTLNRPQVGNALTAEMRDALCDALASVLDDPSRPQLQLRGAGRSFCTGGALPEFGLADDLARAHLVRTLRSPAALLHQLRGRSEVILHGACIGAGIEIGAAAQQRIATANAYFQLPELAMGLIPGAGGTASVARAIGRHRTAFLGLSGVRLSADRACRWGLVHEVMPAQRNAGRPAAE